MVSLNKVQEGEINALAQKNKILQRDLDILKQDSTLNLNQLALKDLLLQLDDFQNQSVLQRNEIIKLKNLLNSNQIVKEDKGV